jgi:hypothetical protein
LISELIESASNRQAGTKKQNVKQRRVVYKGMIDKQSLFGRGGHLRLKTVLKQGFHGAEDAGIGMGSQDRVRITLFKAPRQGWERARPGFAVRDADRGHTGPTVRAQPFAYIMTGSVS